MFLSKAPSRPVYRAQSGGGTSEPARVIDFTLQDRRLFACLQNSGATTLPLLHNHPSGDPKPSRDDIEMTREVKAATEGLGIAAIHDRLVIGRKGHASFRSLGLL